MPRPTKGSPEAKAWAEKMRIARQKSVNTVEVEQKPEEIAPEQGIEELRAQIKEVLDNNKILTAAVLGNRNEGEQLVEHERFNLDPNNYTDPTARLAGEPRLKAVNFDFNYELEYRLDRSRYQTVTGRWTVEPKFMVQLNRVFVNDQGERTNKRIVARKLVFHEDPDAAIIIAQENGLDIDRQNQKQFLDEMRYIRVRDWLFDIFWPKPLQAKDQITEEAIGGTLVQIFHKSSEEAEGIPFDELKSKLV